MVIPVSGKSFLLPTSYNNITVYNTSFYIQILRKHSIQSRIFLTIFFLKQNSL